MTTGSTRRGYEQQGEVEQRVVEERRGSCSAPPSSLAVRLWRSIQPARASALFHYSLLYLALIFVAAAIDPVLLLMDARARAEERRPGPLAVRLLARAARADGSHRDRRRLHLAPPSRPSGACRPAAGRPDGDREHRAEQDEGRGDDGRVTTATPSAARTSPARSSARWILPGGSERPPPSSSDRATPLQSSPGALAWLRRSAAPPARPAQLPARLPRASGFRAAARRCARSGGRVSGWTSRTARADRGSCRARRSARSPSVRGRSGPARRGRAVPSPPPFRSRPCGRSRRGPRLTQSGLRRLGQLLDAKGDLRRVALGTLRRRDRRPARARPPRSRPTPCVARSTSGAHACRERLLVTAGQSRRRRSRRRPVRRPPARAPTSTRSFRRWGGRPCRDRGHPLAQVFGCRRPGGTKLAHEPVEPLVDRWVLRRGHRSSLSPRACRSARLSRVDKQSG